MGVADAIRLFETKIKGWR